MNYFEFLDIPLSFLPDEGAIKRAFYSNSKKYHPDFHTLESAEKQAEVLRLSSLNNEAYQTLSDFDRRMKYLLTLLGALAEEGQNQIPQDFLMEMMEINEALMELEMDFEQGSFEQITGQLETMERALYEEVSEHLEQTLSLDMDPSPLTPIKEYYLKKRYLLRIRENLNKFASP